MSDGVSVLLDKVKTIAFDGNDQSEVGLLDVGVDSLGSVWSSDDIFTQGHPRVVVHDPGRDPLD
jgi:hypothetical protein